MCIVYYDKNAQFSSNFGISGVYVKIHKQNGPHHTKEAKKHSGERNPCSTFDEAYKHASEKATKGQFITKIFLQTLFKRAF